MDQSKPDQATVPERPAPRRDSEPSPAVPEVGGRGGAEPTRYGDWEVNGVCTDF